MNYFLGIRQSDGVLTADFEDTSTGSEPSGGGCDGDSGQRSRGTTPRRPTTARPGASYLDGVLDAQLVVGAFTPRATAFSTPRSARRSTPPACITSGQPQGFFDGVDRRGARLEPRADARPQISRGKNFEIANAPGSARTLELQRGDRHGPGRQHRARHQRHRDRATGSRGSPACPSRRRATRRRRRLPMRRRREATRRRPSPSWPTTSTPTETSWR